MAGIARVLCAVDIDDSTCSAFAQALALARHRGASLLLVCAVPPGEPFNRRSSERLACLIRLRREAELAGVEVRVSVQAGDAAEIVLLHAASRQADVAVVGVEHGRSEGRPWGAVAEDVLRSAPCPTLVVPAGAPSEGAFRSIVCAVDLELESLSIGHALRFAGADDRKAVVLFVANGRAAAGAALEKIEALIPRAAQSVATGRVAVGAVAPEVIKEARAAGADLLVIGARRRNRVSRRLFGATRELLTTSSCPVLALPLDPARGRRLDREAA